MTTLSSIIIILAAQVAAVQAPGTAVVDNNGGTKAAAGTHVAEKDADPIKCERVEEVGSLIRAKKVCMRKSEWEEQRRSDRSAIERAQIQRAMNGN